MTAAEPCKHQFGRRRLPNGELAGKGIRRCALCGEPETLKPQTALVELRRADQEPRFGPAMKALTDMQQRFVIALLDLGNGNATEAYRAAGYSDSSYDVLKNNAHRSLHLPTVQAALREEGQKRLNAASPMALLKLIQFAQGYVVNSKPVVGEDGEMTEERIVAEVDQKLQIKAVEGILQRTGFSPLTEHKVTVEHKTDEEQIARVKQLAQQLGLDPKALLGKAGVVVDAEFTEVPSG